MARPRSRLQPWPSPSSKSRKRLRATSSEHLKLTNGCECRINLVVITPLAENLPGPSANKPGDVYVLRLQLVVDDFAHTSEFSLSSVYAMNGKTVEIDNTDAEGRLVLSGMLHAHRWCSFRLY